MSSGAKEWVQYASAVGMLVSGVVLTFVCFFSRNDVTAHVLYYVGETLLYAGGVVGISTYARTTIKDEMNKLRGHFGDGVDGGADSEEGDVHDRAAAG